jgi:protein required for attachment to host cells
MSENRRSSYEMASLAGAVLDDPRSSTVERQLAASVLSQYAPKDPRGAGQRRSSEEMAALASQILRNRFSREIAKRLAGSVLSQRAD